MLIHRRHSAQTAQRGDTLIEVLFAFTIFSLVVVGAMSIMNQGTIASQRALETTRVRAQIDAQATTIRFLHDAYVANFKAGASYAADTPAGQWVAMTSGLTATSASTFGGAATCPAAPSGSFILNAAGAKYVPGSSGKLVAANTVADVTYDPSLTELTSAQGIWVEGIRSVAVTDVNKQNTRYIDFHIRACWDSPGQGSPMTLGTIVRLYEPRS